MSRAARFAASANPVRRRFDVLHQRDLKTSERAALAGVEANGLKGYLDTLAVEGLVDKGQRPTRMGEVFLMIGEKPGLDQRQMWRRLGGSEDDLKVVLDKLVAEGLIEAEGAGYKLAEAEG